MLRVLVAGGAEPTACVRQLERLIPNSGDEVLGGPAPPYPCLEGPRWRPSEWMIGVRPTMAVAHAIQT